jgi:hypothetical protein
MLGVSVLAHNLVATIWPGFAKSFPLITEGVARRLVGEDVGVSSKLDPCGAALQKLMAEYKFASEDAEAASFKKELDALTAARREGRFGPADELREKELFQKYKELIQRSVELKRMIQESGCSGEDPSPVTSSPLTAKDNQQSAPSGPGGRANQPIGHDARKERLEGFRAVVNSGVGLTPGKRNIAIVIQAPSAGGSLSPVESLYGQLRSDAHLITDLFRYDALTRGYFDDIYQGDPEMLRIATTTTRVDALILGRLNYTFRKGSAVDSELVSCDMGLSYKVANQSGDVIKSDSFQVVGPGFSESAALERAVQLLANRFSESALKNF